MGIDAGIFFKELIGLFIFRIIEDGGAVGACCFTPGLLNDPLLKASS